MNPRAALLLAVAFALPAFAAAPPPPATPRRPVTDTYHGTRVVDDYRWLEDGGSAEVRAWSDAQNARARAVLDALPSRDAIRERVSQLLSWESPSYYALRERRGTLFAIKAQPPRQQPFLVVLPSPNDVAKERVVLDPNVLDPSGETSIDFHVPSPDGRWVAVSLSRGGSESGDVHVYEVATGKERTGDRVPRVNGGTAGGSVAWRGDGSGFFYTRYPRGEERPAEERDFHQQIWFHALGTDTSRDTYALGKDFPRIAEVELESSDDGKHLAAMVQKGDGGEYQLFLLEPAGGWTLVADYADRVVRIHFGRDDALYALSLKDAPRGKVLRIPLGTPSLAKATVLVPEGKAAIEGFLPTTGRLYLVEQLGGPSSLRSVDLTGKDLGTVKTLPVSSVGGLRHLNGDDVLFFNASFVEPPAWYRYSAKDGKVTKTALAQTSPASFADVEVIREEAVSKDGTRVPLTILKPRGVKLDGNNPTLLTGYGGFNLAVSPHFSKVDRAWLEQGGVLAVANLRGGSEFGEAWHVAGSLTRKQNVFDDFHACAQHLVKRRYTQPSKLAIEGGSNGGLLVGAAVTQHPREYKAAVAHVGYFDSLRVESSPNGVFNTTEYGSVKDPEQFKALHAYSPYHQVKDGTQYPAMLFLTGANDPRVNPLHSRKMVARLQASGTKQPVLLRTNNSGHGQGTALSEQIAQQVDVFAFLFQQLGVRYRPVTGKVPTAPTR